MHSKRQKILHEVGGKPMVVHAFLAAESVADRPPVLVVGPGEEGVRDLIGDRAEYVGQPEQLGTGHAAMVAAPVLQGRAQQVLVTYGDMPLLRPQTLAQLAQKQAETEAAVALLSVMGDAGSSFGRVVRDEDGRVTEIVEVAEAKQRENTADLLAIEELNVGVYCFDADWLWRHIHALPLRRARSGQEYYLTDMVGLAVRQERLVEAVVLEDAEEGLSAGTRRELVVVEKAFRRRANAHWLAHGVTLVDPDTIYIDPDVVIGQDTVVWPNTFLQGSCHIGQDCILGPNTIVRDARIGRGCRIEQAVVENTRLDDGTRIAPFTHVKG